MTHTENNVSLLYGLRPLIEAIQAGKEVEKIFIQNGLQGELYHELRQLIRKHAIPFQLVPSEKLNRLTRKNHQGVAAFLSLITYQEIEKIIPDVFERGKIPLIVILDRITDVRNFGAICRSAECAGAHAILIPSRGSALINADAVKASAGALYNIPVCRSENLKSTLSFLKESGLKITACTEKAKNVIYDADFSAPLGVVLGSEEDGISEEYMKLCDEKVRIPLMGQTLSLNVSVAAGILLYETIRQRKEYIESGSSKIQ